MPPALLCDAFFEILIASGSMMLKRPRPLATLSHPGERARIDDMPIHQHALVCRMSDSLSQIADLILGTERVTERLFPRLQSRGPIEA
jgi:hypothetical protein